MRRWIVLAAVVLAGCSAKTEPGIVTDQTSTTVETCQSANNGQALKATGTLTNNGSAGSFRLRVQYLDGSGKILETDESVRVPNLQAGQTGRWDSLRVGTAKPSECKVVEVDRV